MPHVVHRTVCRVATLKIQREGSGFLVRKVIGGLIDTCDPFVLLDHIGPVTYKPGEAVGAPDHPHRGFETVTYVIEGGVKHEDSAGNKGELRSGWLQWMRAGRGVVHSEMPTEELVREGGVWEGFQLWINLPAKDKMMEPCYQDIPPEAVPTVVDEENGATVKVFAGECRGAKGSVNTRTPILLLSIHLSPGGCFIHEINPIHNGFVYVWKGSGYLGHDLKPAKTGTVGLLGSEGNSFLVKADDNEECRILLATGQPLNEPVVKYGPFVMNTEEEIQEAIADYRDGRLSFARSPVDGASGGTIDVNHDSCTITTRGEQNDEGQQ